MISVSDLHVKLGKRPVLKQVSFEAAGGAVIGLVGPNGAGKSTLMKAIAGLLPPSGGSITLEGENIAGLSHKERAERMSWLPQQRPVAWNLQAEDLVTLGCYVQAASTYERSPASVRDAIDQALINADAGHLRGRWVSELSGGELARLHLARTLVGTGQLLLLDEPCNALDISHQLSLMEMLQQEASNGRLVIAALHDLQLARRFCDRIIVLDKGDLIVDGTPQDALNMRVLASVFGVQDVENRLERVTPNNSVS